MVIAVAVVIYSILHVARQQKLLLTKLKATLKALRSK